MDCRKFKELLDSYLCQELAVETNHDVLSHVEHCKGCRGEMSARRNMRASLRRVCAKDEMSEDAVARLRARLRTEAAKDDAPVRQFARRWREKFFAFFSVPLALPIAAAAIALLIAVGGWNFYRLKTPATFALSDTLIKQAAGDHHHCAANFLTASVPVTMPDEVKDFDAACIGLDKVAEAGAQGLQLRVAHVCGQYGRQFAHLVYTQESHLISLLVAARDRNALQAGEVVPFKDETIKPESHSRESLSLGAYQTAKHVVLVVSELPEGENKILAERLAMPVVEHFRRVERTGETSFVRRARLDLAGDIAWSSAFRLACMAAFRLPT